MDLPAYSESFKFWLQFFTQKPQVLGHGNSPLENNQQQPTDLLSDIWTLFQLQQQYSAALGLLNAGVGAGAGNRTQFPLELEEFTKQTPERCEKPQLITASTNESLDNDTEADQLQKNHRVKRTPKRISSANSRHSPASCTTVSASPSNLAASAPQQSTVSQSQSQSQPIIKMDLTKEEIAEISSELSKIENKIGPYKCMLCLFTFDDAIQLACHSCPNIVNVEYRCQECSKVFNCPANLASHRRWHKRRLTTAVAAGNGASTNAALPTFASPVSCASASASTSASASVSTSSYDQFEVPTKRQCNRDDAVSQDASRNRSRKNVRNDANENGSETESGSQSKMQNDTKPGKQSAKFSVEFLLGCKMLDQEAFNQCQSANRSARIETS